MLSGTVEVVTIEEEPETVLVSQGEIAIVTTQEDGSVTLEVREQENTSFHLFSTHFLDDSGEGVEEFAQPDWYEAYAQHLGEIESYYAGHLNLGLNNRGEHLFPVDLSQTTYWLHDWNLDGVPDLLLNFYYPSRGFVAHEEGHLIKSEGTAIFRAYAIGDSIYQHYISFVDGTEVMNDGEITSQRGTYLSVPTSGNGFYVNEWHISSSVNQDYTSLWEYEGDYTNYYIDGFIMPPLLDGTPILNTSTWSHYTDLSGLEWNG